MRLRPVRAATTPSNPSFANISRSSSYRHYRSAPSRRANDVRRSLDLPAWTASPGVAGRGGLDGRYGLTGIGGPRMGNVDFEKEGLGPSDLREARPRVARNARVTPLIHSESLSERFRHRVALKC